jgi:hypothetical protein
MKKPAIPAMQIISKGGLWDWTTGEPIRRESQQEQQIEQ